jgi:hypothetical protein
MIDLEAIIALILEFKRKNDKVILTEFEYLLYEAACNFLARELKGEELRDHT